MDSESSPLSERSVRAVGWSVLIAAAASLVPFAPTEIVAKILAHLCVLGTALLIGLSLKNSGASDGVAFVGGMAIALGSSFWVYANTAFAEPLAGLCIAAAIYSASSRKFPWLLAVALAVAVWTKFQLYPAVAVLWLAAIRQFGIRRMIWPTAFCALNVFGLLAFNYSQCGAIRPPMEWVFGSPGKAFVYYLSDSHGSVFSRKPWLLLAVAAAVLSLIQNFARPSLWWWLLTASLFLPTIFWAEFEGGFGYPGRLVMLAFIPAALLFAPLIESRSLAVKSAAFCLLGLSVLTNFAAALSSPVATWRILQ